MKIKLIHWDKNLGEEKTLLLKSFGNQVDSESKQDKETFKRIKKYSTDVFIIDLSKLPSHGKEIAVALRQIKSTKNVPIIFTEGGKEKVEKIKLLLPDAIYSSWKNIHSALKKASKQRDTEKVVPLGMMERYSNTTLVKKFGIKENSKVVIINAPNDFKDKLGKLPEVVKFFKTLKEGIDLIIWFARSREEFDLNFLRVLKYVDKNKLWVATTKKSSGIVTDINQNIVHNICLMNGLVDYKVCAIDEIWSGLLFTKRKS